MKTKSCLILFPNTVFFLTLLLITFLRPTIVTAEDGKRPVTIADSIQMTVLGDSTRYAAYPVAQFSPDRKHFVVIAHKGNLETNANDYSLLLFDTAQAFQSPTPQRLFTFSSTSNQPGIASVQWTSNGTIFFIGSRGNEHSQIYSYSLRSHHLKQETTHDTDIVYFAASPQSKVMAFFAQPPITQLMDQHSLEYGLRITKQPLWEVLDNRISTWGDVAFLHPYQLFIQKADKAPTKVDLKADEVSMPDVLFSLSPNGKYLLFAEHPKNNVLPDSWKDYEEIASSPNFAKGYCIVSTDTLSESLLIDSPISWKDSISPSVIWLPNSIVFAESYLPKGVDPKLDDETRLHQRFVVEVNLDSRAVTPIVQGDIALLPQSDPDDLWLQHFVFHPGPRPEPITRYRRNNGRWYAADQHSPPSSIQISITQDMNTPAQLATLDPTTQKEAIVFRPNPFFDKLAFGKVENLNLPPQPDGYVPPAGLYLPPDYTKSKKYPLVIQTHGWSPKIFSVDGQGDNATAGYAAQALASRDIIVVQLSDVPAKYEESTLEGPTAMNVYQTVVDYLDQQQMIDRNRVGLMGWSRTGYQIRYTLTHSSFPYAAVVIADGLDASFLQYVMEANYGEAGVPMMEGINGGTPFGDGLQAWFKNTPGFNLDKVHSPIRLLAFSRLSLVECMWEDLVILNHLHKPVDLIYLPDAKHDPVKPSERVTAQQGDVDWFCFWLKNEEDPIATKRDEYTHWHRLRNQQSAASSQTKKPLLHM